MNLGRPDHVANFQQVFTEVMRYQLRAALDLRDLQFGIAEPEVLARIDLEARRIISDVVFKLLGKKWDEEIVQSTEVIEFKAPLDWWQAFRERWFPRWWLRRHPVRYRVERREVLKRVTVHRYNVCPHIKVQDNTPHVAWLMENRER